MVPRRLVWHLSAIGYQLSAISYQLSAISYQLSAIGYQLSGYLTCLLTSFVISNMLTCALPPKTGFNMSSDLIIRLFF